MSAVEMLKELHISDYILTFFILSFVGWTVETIYCSLGAGKFINRGFLTGPLCPIYGTGAIVFSVMLSRLYARWYLVLLVGIVLADAVEYITSFLMEKLFHARWWDYSEEFLNIKGRICFKHTCYWGIAALVYIYFFQPFYLSLYLKIPMTVRQILLAVIFVIFILDLINAVKNAIDVRKFMEKLTVFSDRVTAISEEAKSKLTESGESLGEELISTFYNLSRQIENFRTLPDREIKKGKAKKRNRIYSAYGNLKKNTEKKVQSAQEYLAELKKLLTEDEE